MSCLAARVSKLIERRGKPISYVCITAGNYDVDSGTRADPQKDIYAVKAVVRQYSPKEIADGVKAGDSEVRIGGLSLNLFTPKDSDLLIIDGTERNIKAVHPVHVGDDVAQYVFHVSGVS